MTSERVSARGRFSRFALLLVALGVVQAPIAVATEPAMTNDDVVKLAKLGFGSDVIEAKIKQASAVNFKLDVDDLTKLKSAGVPQGVISAMLKRATPDGGAVAAGSGAPPGVPPGAAAAAALSDIGTVRLSTKDRGDLALHSIGGSMSTTYAYVTTLMHANYPGLKADVRIKDRRPTLLVKSFNSPKGRMYLVSAESDAKNGVRSVKLGNAGLFGHKNLGAPDSDNQIAYDVVAEGTGGWRLTPTKDLEPGEYGLWTSIQELYDFGIDP